ncbi:hypothetical protein Aperf_G00000004460 [Anoplocephala perfoliata]
MAKPLESTDNPAEIEECTALQPYNQLQAITTIDGSGAEGVLASCIISQTPPSEIVNTTTTTSTITDSEGRVKKLKTTTTTTLRTTTTVRRVCVVAPGAKEVVGELPALENALPEGTIVLQGTPALPQVPGEGTFPTSPKGSEVVRLTHVSGDEGDPKQAKNITQLTFVKPHTQTSEVVEECERQFATRLGLARRPSSDGSTAIVDQITSQSGKATAKKTATLKGGVFPSLFDGLPLYQGYGMISQHAKDMGPSETPISIFFDEPLYQIDVGSLTKMFEDVTKNNLLTNDLNSLFGDLTITPKPLEGPGVEIEEVKDEDKKEMDKTEPKVNEAISRKESAHSASSGVTAAADLTEAERLGYKNQILNQLATKTGPCRIAWSEMPEVITGNVVSSLTRHEIQLQEAMFEVITSEASYYRSLRVLIEHFYSAPEFDCSRSANANMDNSSSGAENDSESSLLPTNESRPSVPGLGIRAGSISSAAEVIAPVVKPALSPTEKHHLFSNVLLICMASERFLQDLEARWSSQKPLLIEVCDLIVKHAGSVQFEPYLTYLRNQTYQVAAYRRLLQREDFQKAIARMHAHPAVGKNHLDSFLALPMQRLTRLKLLVEVIQKLQSVVAREAEERAAAGSTETMTPGACENVPKMKITEEQLENASIALRELKRLLSESESEKKLMDEKARLLALSSALEFPENVKRIAISDKRLIKEGELRSANSDGKAAVLLKKLGRKKPDSFYLILFHDLLMVTKLKKNDRYLVQDYCPRDKVYVTIGNPSEASLNRLASLTPRIQTPCTETGNSLGVPRRQKRPSILGLRGGPRHHTISPEVPIGLLKKLTTDAPLHLSPLSISSASSNSSTMEVCGTGGSPASPPLSPARIPSVRLKRSGSSLSSKSVPSGSSYAFPSSTINRDLPLLLYIFLTESQSGVCTEFCLTTNDNAEYEAWYRALHSKSLKLNTSNNEQMVAEEEAS